MRREALDKFLDGELSFFDALDYEYVLDFNEEHGTNFKTYEELIDSEEYEKISDIEAEEMFLRSTILY